MLISDILRNIDYLISNIDEHQKIANGVHTNSSIENIDMIINSLMSCNDTKRFNIIDIYKSLHCVIGNVKQLKYIKWYTLYKRMLVLINTSYDISSNYSIYILRRYDNDGMLFIDVDY